MSFLSFMRSLSDLTQAIPEEGDPVSTDPASTISPEFDSVLGTLSSTLSGTNQDTWQEMQSYNGDAGGFTTLWLNSDTGEITASDPYAASREGWQTEQTELGPRNYYLTSDGQQLNYDPNQFQQLWDSSSGTLDQRIATIAHQNGSSYADIFPWLIQNGYATYDQLKQTDAAYQMESSGYPLRTDGQFEDNNNFLPDWLINGTENLAKGGALALTGAGLYTGLAGAGAAGTAAAGADVTAAAGAMGGAAGAAGGGLTTLEAAGGLAGLSGATAGTAAGATLGAETLAGAGGTVGLTDVLSSGAGSAGGGEVFDDIFDLGDLGDVGGDIFGDDYGDVLDGVIGGDFPDMGDFNWEDINLEDFDWGEVFGGENMEDLYDDFWNYFSQEAMGGLVPTNSGPNWWDVGFGLLQYQGQRQFQNDIINSMNQAVERSDPFYSQRPFYQQQFQQMNTDPNYFQNDAALQNLQNSAMRSMASQDAAKGYLNSGNILHDLTRTGVETAANYVLPRMDMSARAAGAYNDPSKAGQMIAAMSPIAASAGLAQNQTLGQIGRSATGAQTGTNSGTNPITSLAQWLTA